MQNPGQIRIYAGGIIWKRQGGGKLIEVDKSDIMGVTWMKVPRTNQLGVQIKDGLYYKFTGFRDQVTFSTSLNVHCRTVVIEKRIQTSGLVFLYFDQFVNTFEDLNFENLGLNFYQMLVLNFLGCYFIIFCRML